MTTNRKPFPPRTELSGNLAEKEYRDAFVESRIRRGVPLQIRAIRESLGWSQEKLAERSGIKPSNISRTENTRDTFLAFPTLLKIAAAFDMALVVKFASFSELEDLATLPAKELVPPSYDEDSAARDEEERAIRMGDPLLAYYRRAITQQPDRSSKDEGEVFGGSYHDKQGGGVLFYPDRGGQSRTARHDSPDGHPGRKVRVS